MAWTINVIVGIRFIKITKILNSEANSKRKVPNQKKKHSKGMDNNCHITDLLQAFFSLENGGWNLVLKLAKPLTCMPVASNSRILTMML